MKNLDKRISLLPQSVYLKIAQIDELKGQWVGGANLSPQILTRLQRSVLATSTGASTRIEGSKLSDIEVEKLMRGLNTTKFKDRDSQEVAGYYQTLQLVFDNYQNMDFTKNTILHLHNQLLKYSQKDEYHKGGYKKQENSVEMKDASGKTLAVLFETTPAYLTPVAMKTCVEWLSENIDSKQSHPLIVIAAFIVEFLKIHPFLDGNGRMSRVLTNLLLLQSGYEYVPYVSLEKIIESTKTEYYIALRKSQVSFGKKAETVLPWVEYFLDVAIQQAKEATMLLSIEDIENILSPQQLKVWQFLNTTTQATPGEIAKKTGVARATVSQAVSRLIELKRVERIGQGSTTRYRKL